MRFPDDANVEGYYAAMAAGNRTHFRMVFEGGVELTEQDIDISTGVTITDSFNSESDLKFGKVGSKELTTRIILSERTSSINWGKKFKVAFGVEDGEDDIIWVNFGTFFGKRPKNVSSVDAIDFVAYDIVSLLNQSADEFVDELPLPGNAGDWLDAMSEELGFNIYVSESIGTAETRNFNSNHFKKNSYTYAEIVGNIAEACGGGVRVLPQDVDEFELEDQVIIRLFKDNIHSFRGPVTRDDQFYEEHADLYAGMDWNEFDALTLSEQESMTWDEVSGYYKNRNAFDGVVVSKVSTGVTGKYPSRCKGHLYEVKENPVMLIVSSSKASYINNYVKPLYEYIQELGGALPMTVECVGDFLIEAGDIIQVELPEGETVDMPIYYKTMKWNGALVDRYETTAAEI